MVEELRRHAVAGRLDLDELEARAEAAYGAKTVGELVAVLHDLPRERRPRGRATRFARATWHLPAAGTVSGAATTAVVAHFDGGFRGPFDGVAAVPLWVTVALGGILAATIVVDRVGSAVRVTRRPRRAGS